jgi:uncharacterized delta-60 repeat protein
MRTRKLAVLLLPVMGALVFALVDCVGDESVGGGGSLPDGGGADTSSGSMTDGTVPVVDSGGATDAGSGGDANGEGGSSCKVPDPALSGTLDTTFSTGTKVIGAGHFYARAATTDPSGGVYVVGSVPDNDAGGGDYDIAVLHIFQDGTVDPSFTSNANPLRYHYTHLDFGFGAATLPSGAPIFVGSSGNGASAGNGVVLSVVDSGAYNTAFNPTGAQPGLLELPSATGTVVGAGCGNPALSDTSTTLTTINAIAASADKIAIVGSNVVNVCSIQTFVAAGSSGFVMLLNKDGSINGTFNGGAVLQDSTVAGFYGVSFDAAGNVLAIGQNIADAGANRTASVRRYTAAGAAMGSVDVTANGGMIGRSIGVLPDGKVVIAGATEIMDPTFAGTLGVMRLTSALAVDSTFNGGKVLEVPLNFDAYLQYSSLAILCDGTVLAAGTWQGDAAAPDPQDMGLAKILSSGALDLSFGEGGVTRSIINGAEIPVGAAQDPTTGKVVVIGRDTIPNLVIARFNP